LLPVVDGEGGISRAYRKNDQAWIEQKNGAVVLSTGSEVSAFVGFQFSLIGGFKCR
jgi:hypothetical protein